MLRRFSAGLVLATALLAACGGARTAHDARRPIDALRARSQARPDDPEVWRELAIAEHLEDGGDADNARKALARARQLGVKDLRLVFVEAEQHVLEGRPALALDGFSEVLRRAGSDTDPLAPQLAEAALGGILDMNDAVDDYRPRVRALLTELAPSLERLGLAAAHQARMQSIAYALLAGDVAQAQRLAQDAGCVQRAEVAGPFGPRELLGFDQTWPAEQPGPLRAEYDLGVGRGKAPTRKLDTRRCLLGLGRGAHDPLPGTSVLRGDIEVPAQGQYALRVESPNSLLLSLDGREILRADLRTQHASGVRYIPLELAPGKHELRAKISSRHPNPVLSLALVPAGTGAVEQTVLPEAPAGGLERYLAAKLSLARGDGVAARELMRKAGQLEPTAHWLVLEAAAALADPLRPGELRRDRARDLLRKAQRQNPSAWYPTVGLANLEAAEGRTKEAIESLRQAEAKWPDVIAIRTTLIEQLRERGYPEEADRRLEQLARMLPNACAVSAMSLGSARARGRMAEVIKLSERAMECDATSTARFSLYKAKRQYDRAAEELLRLRSLADVPDESQRIEGELDRAQLAGDVAAEKRLRAQRSELWADRPGPVLDRVDVLRGEGQEKEALAYLANMLQKHPNELYELRRVHAALGGAELFAGLRKDGAEVIRAFEASGKTYHEPQLLLLDYTVVRVFEDGSSVDLTHNIMRVQSQEAVDENGEFGLPDGARLLTLHTVKADGTRLEPEAIDGKATLSLPNLSPGDYVEFEMMRGESPSPGFPGGYLGNRFYFKSFEVPFDHTELVVVLPPNVEPVIDPRGPAPQTVRETKDGLTILRWAADESRPLSPEPSSVASREFLPSINLGINVSWQAYVESLRDLLSDKDMRDPAALETVDRVLGDGRSAPASVRAAKLHRWVTDQIEPTDDVFGVAPAMLAARTGNRERVLRYMLSLAGIPSDLALVRGAEADHSPASLPDPETYGYLLLRVQTESGPVWVHAGARHAPFGYLPPHLRGEGGMILNAQAEPVTTPASDLERDLRTIDAEIELASEGSAKLHVRETHRGQSAVGWRNDLDEIPAAELEARFEESYAANVVPGARLKKLTIEGREDAEKPLIVAYELEIDRLGQRSGDDQRIPGLFPNQLSAQFARQGARTTAELIASPVAVDVNVRYTLPESAKVAFAPKQVAVEHANGARFKADSKTEGRKVELTRSLRFPVARVAPDAYAELAGFCRAVDLAEASDLAIQM